MWEEHPEYQKFQARMVGIIVLTLFVLYAGFAIVNRDWDLLKNTLLLAGALVAVLGMLSGMACCEDFHQRPHERLKRKEKRCLTNRCRQRGMASPVPLSRRTSSAPRA
jgi:hypothetical protein